MGSVLVHGDSPALPLDSFSSPAPWSACRSPVSHHGCGDASSPGLSSHLADELAACLRTVPHGARQTEPQARPVLLPTPGGGPRSSLKVEGGALRWPRMWAHTSGARVIRRPPWGWTDRRGDRQTSTGTDTPLQGWTDLRRDGQIAAGMDRPPSAQTDHCVTHRRPRGQTHLRRDRHAATGTDTPLQGWTDLHRDGQTAVGTDGPP